MYAISTGFSRHLRSGFRLLDYTYNLSKRTSVYGQVSYTDYDNKATGNFYSGINQDSVTGVQIGMTHKF